MRYATAQRKNGYFNTKRLALKAVDLLDVHGEHIGMIYTWLWTDKTGTHYENAFDAWSVKEAIWKIRKYGFEIV